MKPVDPPSSSLNEQNYIRFLENERNFAHAIIDTIGTIVIVVDPQGSALRFNKTAEEITGYSANEIIGRKILDILIPAEDRVQKQELFKLQQSSPLPRRGEAPILTKNGEQRMIEWVDAVIADKMGVIKYIIYTGADVTNQRKVENELLLTRDDLAFQVAEKTEYLIKQTQLREFIMDSVNIGILVVDSQDQVFQVNQPFRQYYTEATGCEIPDSWTAFQQHNGEQVFVQTVIEVVMAIKPQTRTIETIPGKYLRLESDGSHLAEDGTEVTVVEAYDISDFMALANLRKQFIATASHELRTPTTVILQCLNNLKRYKDRLSIDQRNHLFGVMDRNANILAELIEDLLILSQIDQNRLKLNWSIFRPSDLFQTVLGDLESLRKQKEIQVTLEVDSELEMKGDAGKIARVFHIILDNALKYSNNNTEVLVTNTRYSLGVYNPKNLDGILFTVTDHGIGIKPEDQKNLFKRFFRVDIGSEVEGMGLGLAIAQELVRCNQGEIYFESEFGCGSRFHVFLPVLELPQ